MLGLGSKLTKQGMPVVSHVTDNLKMLHRYNTGEVVPVSDGAVYFKQADSNKIETAAILSTGTSISVSCWIKTIGTDNEFMGIIAAKETGTFSYDKWLLRRRNNDTYEWVVDWSSKVAIASSKIEDNKWHHLCGTYDGTTIKFYLDGVLEGTQSESSHDISCDIGIALGSYWSESNTYIYPYDGYMSNAAIWTTALTQAQIKSIMWKNYADLTESEKTNLVSWCNLSADANDSHGSNNGTLS